MCDHPRQCVFNGVPPIGTTGKKMKYPPSEQVFKNIISTRYYPIKLKQIVDHK